MINAFGRWVNISRIFYRLGRETASKQERCSGALGGFYIVYRIHRLIFLMPKFWRAVFNRRVFVCIFTGFTSGLPLYVLVQLVPFWLRAEGIGLKEIGFFTLIGFPYAWKFIWAPLLDRYWMQWLGRRRTWMLAMQIPLAISIAALPFFDPQTRIWTIAYLAAAIAFFSATLDIALDAYRREILPDQELGMGNSIHVNAYRLSSLIPGSLALILSDHIHWQLVFLITAAFMFIGIAMAILISEPKVSEHQPTSFEEAVINPFTEFFGRDGWRTASWILAFMFLYKIGDNMATALSTPFYLDLGFSGTEIGSVAKHAALWPSIIGALLGGMLMIKIGINRALWAFGVVQVLSILGFAVLARSEPNLWLLGGVIGFEYLGVGLGTAALVAFIARSTSKAYTATQFALFTALTAIPRTFANASTGAIVEHIGWESFFYLCTLIAVPGMLLLIKVAPWSSDQSQ